MAHFVYPAAASAQPATAYPAQTAPAQQAYSTAAAPRTGQAYESYPTAHATTQYAYATPTPVAVTPAVTYDQTKAYDQASLATTADTATETHHQAGNYVAVHSNYQHQTFKPKLRQPLRYCDVCKIICSTPRTYREHLNGKKHMKKEAAVKSPLVLPAYLVPHLLKCELCDVIFTDANNYAVHIQGAKHLKIVELYTKQGIPMPSTTPIIITSSSHPNATASSTTGSSTAVTAVGTTEITLAGGLAQENTTGEKAIEVKTVNGETTVKASDLMQTSADEVKDEEHVNILDEKDVALVGHEYIEELRNDQGKLIGLNCKLCRRKFRDPNAKDLHLMGRRHRLQYKKKVFGNLEVEVRPSILDHQPEKEFGRLRGQDDEQWRDEMSMEEKMYWEHQRQCYDMEYYPHGPMGMGELCPPYLDPGSWPVMRKPDSTDDCHVNVKHTAIYPTEEELNAVQTIVSACERSLKLVSDFLAVRESRILMGVKRVGVLAKGLLLHGDLNVQLVVVCAEKPTLTLLERVADCLAKQLAMATEKYEVHQCMEEAAIVVTAEKEPKPSCIITLTSPIMRDVNSHDGETVSVKDPPDVLDRQKCLAALAALRRAKWFQARATGLPSCVVVIRILREMCRRVPTWSHLSQWALELLVEKCVSSGGPSMNPGEALRRVFECVSSGLILPGGPGIYDPCEKEPTDALASMTNQMREDLVASAQHALRLIAFRQIHKVLAMEPLPLPLHLRQCFTSPCKRRNTDSVDGTDESALKKEKKDDKGVAESSAEQE